MTREMRGEGEEGGGEGAKEGANDTEVRKVTIAVAEEWNRQGSD